MNKSNLLLLFFLLLMAVFPSMAQRNFKVTGKVVSATDGQGLPGVSILIKGEQIGTITDSNGNFSISIDETKDILIISMIGFEKKEISGIKDSKLNVALSEETQKIEDVMVVGYGVQKKASSVGAITQTKGDELVRAPGATNISSALAGLLPGVTAIQISSEPGMDQAKITIRGMASWVNANPLVLVDGIERSYNDIDPNEVETVSVLKDASATAVFGVRGANGVILITTKRGTIGEAKINFSSTFGVKQIINSWKFADHVNSMYAMNQSNMSDRLYDLIYSEQYIDNWRYKKNPYFYPELDWNEIMFKDFAPVQQYNLNISGGTSFIKYFTSVGYLNDQDIMKTEPQKEYDPRIFYKRYNFRTNVDMNISKTTVLSVNLAGDISVRNKTFDVQGQDGLDNSSTGQALYSNILSTPNYEFPLVYEDGIVGQTARGPEWNPYLNFNYQGAGREKASLLFTDVFLKQDLDFMTKGLTAQAKISYNTDFKYKRSITKKIQTKYQANENSEAIYSPAKDWVEKPATLGSESVVNYNRDLYYELAINYARNFGGHEVTALGLFSRRKTEPNVEFPYYEENWVGRVTYNYKNRYFGDYNGSYTGSEKFAPGLRFAFFQSGAIGWMITEEPFIKALNVNNVLSRLKIRGSFGTSGFDKGAPRFGYVTDYSDGNYMTTGDLQAYNNGPLYFEGNASNPNATWEVGLKQNIGFELGLWGKLNIEGDFFRENRSKILMGTENSNPNWVGQKPAVGNIGKTKNHGYEFTANWKDLINKDLSYYIKASYTFQENRVVFRNDTKKSPEYTKYAGKPINFDSGLQKISLLKDWDDVYNYAPRASNPGYQQPGEFAFNDYNADGIVEKDGPNDKVPYELTSDPAKTFSLSLGLTYRNIDLRAMFYGVSDVMKYPPGAMLWDLSSWNALSWDENSDYWREDNVDATFPRPQTRIADSKVESDFGRQDASYIRLKNVELSYNIVSAALKKYLGVNTFQVFTNGDNLITWTSFDRRIDPEASSGSASPLTRRYNLGVRISF